MFWLGQAEKLFYKITGYVILPNIFSQHECDEIITAIKKHTDQDFRRQVNLERIDTKINDLVNDPRIRNNVEVLHDNHRMGYLGSQVIYKQPGTPFAKHAWNPHQDNFYIRVKPDYFHTMATVVLVDSTPENGGMYFYPGSQVEPVTDHELNPSDDPNKNPGHRILNIPHKYRRVDVWLKKGDLMFHHGNIIHGSTANLSSNSRYAINISCVVEDVEFNPGGKGDRKFTPFSRT